MMNSLCRHVGLATFCLMNLSSASLLADEIRFNRDVLPILAENCFACHGFDSSAREADLRLDTRQGATGEASGGGVVVPGDPEASELMVRVASEDPDSVMPPPETGKHLTAQQRETLSRWIAQGASYESHWSFVAPRAEKPPTASDSNASNHPIDRFVRAKLFEAGLQPSPLADPSTLIRRVSLDLIGLPPTVAEIDAFEVAMKENSNQAWLDLVDRLLNSPHYGERWARWWLDQARYADSNGYSIDSPRSIWKYRDWVIEAMNRDMSFDQFTIEQLAGDLLPDADVAQQIATGFHRNTQINQEGGIDKEQFRIDSVFDRVATTGTVWLGLTVGCAQCHDHKFDPISQREFYQLFAFFNNQDEPSIKVYPTGMDVPSLTSRRKTVKAALDELLENQADSIRQWEAGLTEQERKQLGNPLQKILDKDNAKRSFDDKLTLLAVGPAILEETVHHEFQALHREYEMLGKQLDEVPTTMVLRERSDPRVTTVLIKGDFTRPGEEVNPGTPAALHPFANATDNANRLDLARWLVSPDNPLTARVIVNRVWQQYFGRGLVATENDFGLLGERPTHPALLDWLATEFMANGWSMKELHRLIVTSQTYQQSSRLPAPEAVDGMAWQIDPDNRLLWRQNRLRLDAEIVRDVALTASGLLSRKIGGPPVFPPIPDGVMSQGQVRRSWTVSKGEDRYRRGLYTFLYRATPPPSLSVFDAPDGFSSCTRRNRSNTPLQSLTLMNDAAFFEFAEALKGVIEEEGMESAFRRCTARRPSAQELAILANLDSLTAARAMLNLDETITRE
jgi:hypothetical protein